MFDYSKGKIYKLVCSETNKIYIGSTIQPLEKRLKCHKTPKNRCITRNFVNPRIYLLLDYPCNTKQELLKKETEFIKNTDCVNTRTSYTSKEEKLEQRKVRYKINIEKHKESSKKRYLQNKSKITERSLTKIKCECGSIQFYGNLTRHKKTKKHIDAMNT